MIESAKAISGFLPNAQVAPVSPIEEPVFILTSRQLKAIIADAIHEATNSILSHVSTLEARINALEARSTVIEAQVGSDLTHLANGLGEDRKRLSALEQQSRTVPPAEVKGERTAARISKLKEFLKARGGGATFQEIQRLLNIKPNQLTRLVSQLDKRSYEIFARSGDKRQRVIRLKARIIQ